MTAEQLAKQVSEYIKFNGIDVTQFEMDEIIQAYFMSQLRAIDEAGQAVMADMLSK